MSENSKNKMKIIYVNTPHQDEQTLSPQVIDGEIPHWTVDTHMLKLGQTLRGFLQQRWERVITEYGEGVIEGFYLYNVTPVGQLVGNPKEGAMFVRCAYIKIK